MRADADSDGPYLDAALATAATDPVLGHGGLEVRPVHSGGPVGSVRA